MWELKRTYRRAYRIIRIVVALLLLGGGAIAMFCGISELMDYRNIKLLIVAVFVVITAFAMITAANFSIDGLRYSVVINEDGIGLHKGDKEKIFLQWDRICDVGIGYQMTHIGRLKTLYFADYVLSDEMKNRLELQSGNCIYVSDMTEKEAEIVKRKCSNWSEDVSKWMQER